MAQAEDFDIVGSYNNQRITNIDAERSVNLFEYIDPLGKKPKVLINSAGLINSDLVFTGATNGFRAQFTFQTNQYVVIGTDVYEITAASVVTKLNSTPLVAASGYVGIDANTFQVIFVDGANGYIWDTMASTFKQITDTSFPANPIDVCFLDGFFVVAHGGTNNFQLSSFDQGMVWGPDTQTFTADDTPANNWLILTTTANYQTGVPFQVSTTGALPVPLVAGTTYYAIRLDATHIRVATTYANAIAGTAIVLTTNGAPTNTITSLGQLQQGSITSHPGNIVACRTLHRRLFLFSAFYTEVWENAGIGTNLPFRRNNTLLMEYGTPALGSVAVGFDRMYFLSQDRDGLGSVMEVMGTQSTPVSNRALDFQLAQYAADGHVTDCRSYLIKQNGLIFYRMNFTAANHTYVYNVTLSDPQQEQGKLWHEEEVLNGNRHPTQCHAYFNGLNYAGHYSSPTLYLFDNDTFTNDGEQIRRMRITKAIVTPGYQRRRIDRLQIDLLQGTAFQIGSIIFNEDLLTENSFTLLTEGGNEIILEQGISVSEVITPIVFLSISKNGGQTYDFRLRAPMGAVGETTFRTLWRKLGVVPRGQAFVCKIEFFDPVPFIILGGAWAYEILPE